MFNANIAIRDHVEQELAPPAILETQGLQDRLHHNSYGSLPALRDGKRTQKCRLSPGCTHSLVISGLS